MLTVTIRQPDSEDIIECFSVRRTHQPEKVEAAPEGKEAQPSPDPGIFVMIERTGAGISYLEELDGDKRKSAPRLHFFVINENGKQIANYDIAWRRVLSAPKDEEPKDQPDA